MKRFLIYSLIAVVLILNILFSIIVIILPFNTNVKIDRKLASILSKDVSNDEKTVVLDALNLSFDEKSPILKVYLFSPVAIADRSFEELCQMSSEASSRITTEYILLAKSLKQVTINGGYSEASSVNVTDIVDAPKYLVDISNLERVMLLDGKMQKLTGIVCFDSFSHSSGEAVVYVQTQEKVYVIYYYEKDSSGLLLTEEKFKQYTSEYTQYLKDNSYDDNGNALYGQKTFYEYLQENYSEVFKHVFEQKLSLSKLLIIVGFAVTTIVCFVCGIAIYRKRRSSVVQTI